MPNLLLLLTDGRTGKTLSSVYTFIQGILFAQEFSFLGFMILTDIHRSNAFTQPEWGKGKRGGEKRGQHEVLKFLLGYETGDSYIFVKL